MERLSVGFNNVLIDTWWNVNLFTVFVVSASPEVLIDTWWNVNPTLSIIHLLSCSF